MCLFDVSSSYWRLEGWRKDLWELSHIGIPDDDKECRDSIVFGNLLYWFLKEVCTNSHLFVLSLKKINYMNYLQFLSRLPGPPPMVITHFHEWLTGVGLLLCRLRKLPVSTVFTTHATLLGRYLCAGSVDFYNNLSSVSSCSAPEYPYPCSLCRSPLSLSLLSLSLSFSLSLSSLSLSSSLSLLK